LATNQISRQRGQSIELILRPAIFGRDVLTLDEAGFFQTLAKRHVPTDKRISRRKGEKPDHRHCRPLRLCRDRPCDGAAEKLDELAPSHD
jgi:hypothetical protein